MPTDRRCLSAYTHETRQSEEGAFHPAIPSEMVKWLLADKAAKDGTVFLPDINISSKITWNDQILHSSNTYREHLDMIKDRCGCAWFVDLHYPGNAGSGMQPVFHFVDVSTTTDGQDITDTLLMPSTCLSAIGSWNDITIISAGNTLPPGTPGSEIPDTRPHRGVYEGKFDDGTGLTLTAPTLYNPNLVTDQIAQQYADSLADYSRFIETNKTGAASPVCMGIDPPLLSEVWYNLRGTRIQGKVIHKTIEFSADGWITHLEVVRN